MRLTLYANSEGALSFHDSPGAEAVPFELADGYRIGEGIGGAAATYVFGRPGTLGMTLQKAIDVGILWPAFDQVIASTDPKRNPS
jgi:hypothetical protein